MPIRLRCPNCNAKLSVATRKSGQSIQCPGCKTEIAVPNIDSPAGEAARQKAPQEAPRKTPEPVAAAAAPVSDLPTYDQLWGDDEPEQDDEDGVTLQRRGGDEEEMDLTPMVDVTFLLLIFFMITASFSIQKVVSSSPPQPNEEGVSQEIKQEDPNKAVVKIEIDGNDQLFVEGTPVGGVEQLADAIVQEMVKNDTKAAEIQYHYMASHEIYVKSKEAAAEAGIDQIKPKVQLGTKPGE